MTEITIVVSPAFDKRGKRRHGRFDVHLQGNNEVICEATQQPLLDASRVLLRRGADPTTTICKVRADKPTIVTMRAAIGVAAQYDVMGEKFVKRRPATEPISGSEIGNALARAPAGSAKPKPSLRASHAHRRGRARRSPASSTTLSAPTKANKKPA
jgi:hypothetical protein